MANAPVNLDRNSPEVEAAYNAVPSESVAEIIDGELHVQPRPARRHARAASRLDKVLGPFDLGDGPGGWVILFEPELHLGPRPDKLAPDLAGWRRERMPDAIEATESDANPAAYFLAPDWICEVLSVGTERTDRSKKMRIYRREGVRHVWLVSPIQQTLEIYALEGPHYVLIDTHEGDAKVRAAPFDALELDLSLLWAG